jgi:hypothetical protein
LNHLFASDIRLCVHGFVRHKSLATATSTEAVEAPMYLMRLWTRFLLFRSSDTYISAVNDSRRRNRWSIP